MVEIAHRTIEANGLRIHFAEAGEGPLVLMCHGFPESWYSWRHQLLALAEAGYHAVAPDMRGYGRTDRPDAIEQYTVFHLVGDMVALVEALGADKAVIAWHAAQFRPDRFRAIMALSVPFRPRGSARPTSRMRQTENSLPYQLYFQTPGAGEAELERDPRASIRRILYWASADAAPAETMVPRGGGLLSVTVDPERLPSWLTEADIDFYAGEFARAGFRGALNWYRNIDRNWELMAPFAGMG